jgi:hypothetical protein
LLEPVTVGPEEFEDAAAEFARSVQIVSRLPDQICIQNPCFGGLSGAGGSQPGHKFLGNLANDVAW